MAPLSRTLTTGQVDPGSRDLGTILTDLAHHERRKNLRTTPVVCDCEREVLLTCSSIVRRVQA
jgi:hypothetical protein